MRATLFAEIRKDMPGVGAVHATTALGNQRKKGDDKTRAQLFRAIVAGGNTPLGTNVTGAQVGKRTVEAERQLAPNVDGTAPSPFGYDPNALANLRPDQVPRFFGALTDQDRLPTKRVALDQLTAMQDRVDPTKAEAMRGRKRPGKQPLVVGTTNHQYIADGHHRLTAQWLDGEDFANVRYLDLAPYSTALKRAGAEWSIPYEIAKMDAEQRLVFGWASVVTKDGTPVIDHQGDIIPVPELEKAAYDFVLYSREGDDLHVGGPTSRCVESMVFTKQKQELLGVDLGMEGWWTGFKVDSEPLWQAHKRGERPEFSIGGAGVRMPV